MIDVHDVTFRYPRQERPALQGVNLCVRRGSLFGLLGPNGSGKTTLISILTGVVPLTGGTVVVDGLDMLARTRDVQRFSAFVPQENSFYPTLTVAENLDFFARVQGVPSRERQSRIDEMLDVCGLRGVLNIRTGRLSGGLKRRTSIAIGLLNRPRLLFLDEPTVGIDPQSRRFLLEAIREINATGTTVVFSSHYMEEVESLCDDVAILEEGRVITQGSLKELLSQARGRCLRIDASEPLTTAQRAAIEQIPGSRIRGSRIEIEPCSPTQLQPLLAILQAHQIAIAALEYGAAGLEDVFLSLTRTTLRDG